MTDSTREAIALAAETYEAFMTEVVEAHVITDRVGRPLDEKKQRQLDADRIVDARVVRLMAISGKGGYDPDPRLRERYAESANVTLLDHLLSVVRGAITFAALDTLADNPDVDREALRTDLRQLAAVAFMHDVDKDLELARETDLPLEGVAERWTRYGLDRFAGEQEPLAPDQVRYLIEQAETTQAHRSPPAIYPPRRLTNLLRYVGLADKLDGLWLKEGIDAVLKRLQHDGSLTTDLLRHWSVIELFDPHHPFLVDELQRFISACCEPVPPLIETHQDGRLVMLVPASQAAEIRARAIKRLRSRIGKKLFGLRVNVSNRGVPEILDAQPDHLELTDFMANELAPNDLAKLFRVKTELDNADMTAELDRMLGPIGLAPTWPKTAGQTITPYPNPVSLAEEAQGCLRSAAHLVLLLNHKSVKELPDYEKREQLILDAVDSDRPLWLSDIQDSASRCTMTSLWVTRLATDDADLYARIWGDEGILRHWLEGESDGNGLRDSVQAQGKILLDALVAHLDRRLSAKPVDGDSKGSKRCLFTDIPVPKGATFKESDQLYQIKKSAFSGRDARLESIESDQGETHISPVSYAEHRFRALVHADAVGKPDGIPTLLSSPSTTGLFSGLALNNEMDFRTASVYDLSREQIAKGMVYRRVDAYRQRFRIARFERVPDKTKDQVDLLRLLLRACQRTGRPIHLFRGLPTSEKAFFSFDAMPSRLADLIGGERLRIEQIPRALNRLETANLILETNGLGFEVFDRYARSETRLGAVCLAWAQLHDEANDGKPDRSVRFRHEFEHMVEERNMSETDAPLVALGRAAARIQQRPRFGASANEEMLAFNLSLAAVIDAWKLGQRDPESMTMAVAGELETNFARKRKFAKAVNRPDETLQQALLSFAQRFVNDVWFGVLNGRPPSQANRRILGSIYRMSFLTAPRPKGDGDADQSNDRTE